METVLTIVGVLAVIALGVFVIHRLNAQHADRIASRRYSSRLPDRRSGPGSAERRPGNGARDRHDQRDGGREGRRPRRRGVKRAREHKE
ncbi:hypothetical protein [Streptomyces alkaliterrae]|uniref:Uncharacterized protein n=1 Tax=Streptomyces alkaliterrae TaxID=2213162 RepID=A0A5P0YS98_9ACTN|nr:hypothetical protein [Streptomyces alkaliterrae]MBB1255172.1 hypothetical protein [Streptomyces alkaliterrae]MBB1261138.1 hypothetical protein [Streptomyces alkaliterrae]MQS03165.1 hypothetical protein [Streptomyces alkaliterrae]